MSHDASLLGLDELKVGARFRSPDYTVTEDEILQFARQYDPQPFHTDPEAARGTFFRGLAASGWHTAAITMRLLVQGGLPLHGGIVGMGGQMAWPAPLRPGTTVHVETTVLEVTPHPTKADRGTALCRSETMDAAGAVVQTAEMKVMVFRRA